jgi:hypothetical protein
MTEPGQAFGERIEIIGCAGLRSLKLSINGQELHCVREVCFQSATDEETATATITFDVGEVSIDADAWLILEAIATKAKKPKGPRFLGQREEDDASDHPVDRQSDAEPAG